MLNLLGRACLFFLLALLPLQAEAGVPIPCTGETIVKVLDIPITSGMKIKSNEGLPNRRLDLGYKFKGCFDGEWVGHVGSDRQYLPLTDVQLKMLLLLAGRTAPPPVPSFWASGAATPAYIWMAILAIAGVVTARKYNKGLIPGTAPRAEAMQRAEAAGDTEPANREAAAANAAANPPAATSPAPARAARIAPRQPTVSPRSTGFGGARPAFGRRG